MSSGTRSTNGHLGLADAGLVVVAIMLGFPDRVHADGMGVFFGWLAYRASTRISRRSRSST
jgi:hypothetical protein